MANTGLPRRSLGEGGNSRQQPALSVHFAPLSLSQKRKKRPRHPFQSGPALVHTPRARFPEACGLPSQEAFGTTGSARWPALALLAFLPAFSSRRALIIAGWSSPVARQAHNLKVIGSNPIPATKFDAVKGIKLKGRSVERPFVFSPVEGHRAAAVVELPCSAGGSRVGTSRQTSVRNFLPPFFFVISPCNAYCERVSLKLELRDCIKHQGLPVGKLIGGEEIHRLGRVNNEQPFYFGWFSQSES